MEACTLAMGVLAGSLSPLSSPCSKGAKGYCLYATAMRGQYPCCLSNEKLAGVFQGAVQLSCRKT
jgi:hypothetical protein